MITSFLVQFPGNETRLRSDGHVFYSPAPAGLTVVRGRYLHTGSSSDWCGRRASRATVWSDGRTAAVCSTPTRPSSSVSWGPSSSWPSVGLWWGERTDIVRVQVKTFSLSPALRGSADETQSAASSLDRNQSITHHDRSLCPIMSYFLTVCCRGSSLDNNWMKAGCLTGGEWMNASALCPLLSSSLVIYGRLTAPPAVPDRLTGNSMFYQTWLFGYFPMGQTGIVILAVSGEDLIHLCWFVFMSCVKFQSNTKSSSEMCQTLRWWSKLHDDCLITLQW